MDISELMSLSISIMRLVSKPKELSCLLAEVPAVVGNPFYIIVIYVSRLTGLFMQVAGILLRTSISFGTFS